MRQDLRFLLPLACMAVLFAISSMPGATMESTAGFRLLTPSWQNLLHIPVYGGLTLAWWWALEHRLSGHRRRAFAAVAITLAYAAVEEFWQSTIPGRYGSFTDFGLDAAGAWLAVSYLIVRLSVPVRNQS